MFDLVETPQNILIYDTRNSSPSAYAAILGSSYTYNFVDDHAELLQTLRENDIAALVANEESLRRKDLIHSVKFSSPATEIVFLATQFDASETLDLFRSGVFDLVAFEDREKELSDVVFRATEKYADNIRKSDYQVHLERLLADRTTEIDRAVEELDTSYRVTLKALVQALETRDFETHGHSERVVTYSLRLGMELGLDRDQLRDLELGALLHDIGKIGVPDAILRKPAKLNDAEWEKMKLHPLHGQRILRNIPYLEGAARVVSQHHEFWDGSGYPYKKRGTEIDLGARIFAVIDAFDAMVSDRVYRKGRPYSEALEELQRCAGSQFDPHIVEAFAAIAPEDWEILRAHSLRDFQEVTSFRTVVSDLVFSQTPPEFLN